MTSGDRFLRCLLFISSGSMMVAAYLQHWASFYTSMVAMMLVLAQMWLRMNESERPSRF